MVTGLGCALVVGLVASGPRLGEWAWDFDEAHGGHVGVLSMALVVTVVGLAAAALIAGVAP